MKAGAHTLMFRSLGPQGQTRTINVKLPRGIAEVSKVRLRGKAADGGDLHVTLRIASHPKFQLDGHDLVHTMKIMPWLAVLGGTVSVETLSGRVDTKLPPGTQNGQKLRLKGKGLPKREEGNSGDLFVRVEIDVPKRLTSRQKELWEELSKLGE